MRCIYQAIGGGNGVAAVALYGISRVFCRSEGDSVGIFTARLPVGSILHLINEGLGVGEGARNEGRASCHTLWGYDGGVGVAALVIRGDYIRVVAFGGETRQLHGCQPLGVVRQNDGHSRRAVGEAERGATVGHRLSVGYDEVTALKVFLGTLVGFYLHSRRSCLALGVWPPRCDGDVVVAGPVVRVGGGQRGARALKKVPVFGKTNKKAASYCTSEQFSDGQILNLFCLTQWLR